MPQDYNFEEIQTISMLEIFSSDPKYPDYFRPLPLPFAEVHLDHRLNNSHLQGLHASEARIHDQPELHASDSFLNPSDLFSGFGHTAGPQHGYYDLGCEPRIGWRAATTYGINANRWQAQALRRWGAQHPSSDTA